MRSSSLLFSSASWRSLLLLALLLIPARLAHAIVAEKIVAVVNKRIILLSEVRSLVEQHMSTFSHLPKKMRDKRRKEIFLQVTNELVNLYLIEDRARKLQLEITDEQANEMILETARKQNLTVEQLEEQVLKPAGSSLAEHREKRVKPSLLRSLLLHREVYPSVSVTDEELRALYDRDLRELGANEKVHLRDILIEINGRESRSELKSKWNRANRVAALARKTPSKFPELAKIYSEDLATRDRGGDLGLLGKGMLGAAVDEVVFRLKAGQVAGPVKGKGGLHICMLVERRESTGKPFEEIRSNLKERLLIEKRIRAAKQWLTELRRRAHVDIRP